MESYRYWNQAMQIVKLLDNSILLRLEASQPPELSSRYITHQVRKDKATTHKSIARIFAAYLIWTEYTQKKSGKDFSVNIQYHQPTVLPTTGNSEGVWQYLVQLRLQPQFQYMWTQAKDELPPAAHQRMIYLIMEARWCMPFGVSFTSPPFSGRNPTVGKQTRSWLASILPPGEKLNVLSGADAEEGLKAGLLWRSVVLPRNFVQLAPPEACCCFCSSSCFVLRNRPPDPRARFMAWRCRDSWRYG